MIKIGILKETKTPPDKRVPLSPKQCKEVLQKNDSLQLVVQKSDIRIFSDADYEAEGISVVEDISDCDILIGVKEVKKQYLIPNKTYFFFSHTIKEQPYNKELLQTILKLNIRLIDWETLTSPKGPRLIGFGRYAGIVGAYNTLLAYGKKHANYNLKPANSCKSHLEINEELQKVTLPPNHKIIITGEGRVARGAMEILDEIKIPKVSPEDFLLKTFDTPVYVQLGVDNYFERLDGKSFEKTEFYANSKGYKSCFMPFAKVANTFIACHYWDSNSPFLFTREDAKQNEFNITLIGDISCDIDGPVASTIRPSTIEEPLYGYDPKTESEVPFMNPNAIGVMAVDNLPCELPADASIDFGNEFITNVLPNILKESENTIIERATICENGKLTKYYSYLQNYVSN